MVSDTKRVQMTQMCLNKNVLPSGAREPFSTGGQAQKSSFIMKDDTLIFTRPFEIVLIVNAI